MDIHNSENVTVVDSYSLARNYERIVAFLIDIVIYLASYKVLYFLFGFIHLQWIGGLIAASYLIFRDNFSLLKNQSIGKKIMKIKVINSNDEMKIKFLCALKRNFIFLPAFVATLGTSYLHIAAFPTFSLVLIELYFLYTNSDQQRLGDQFADTIVIEKSE